MTTTERVSGTNGMNRIMRWSIPTLHDSGASHERLAIVLVGAVLVVFILLLGWSGWRHSPVVTEDAHLASGVSHLRFGRFDLFRVNPPLVRMVAAAAVALIAPSSAWNGYDGNPFVRIEHRLAQDFLLIHGSRSFWLLTVARWGCIPFAVVGGYVCYCWARALYGLAAGLIALALWCFSPYVLGHASLITPDAHAAALGVLASYAFWRWLKVPDWWYASLAGFLLGLAELSKFTLLVFYPVWPVLWLLYRLPARREMTARDYLRQAAMLMSILLLSVCVINLGYAFEGSFRRLGEFRFQTEMLTGLSRREVPENGANRFLGTWLASFPVPLPKNYLQGIDTQKLDFEQKRWSYLRGEWKLGGWWYYYLYALAVKVPLGTWLLVLVAIGVSVFGRRYSAPWRDEMVLLMPLAVILAFVSSQMGINVHSRYALPILPFAFVWTSKVALSIPMGRWTLAAVVIGALGWSIGSSLCFYPHSLSYFNELVGGPKGGHYHLLDSNIGWGQDLLYLKRWLDKRPEARALHLASFGFVDPRLAGIEFTLPPISAPANNGDQHSSKQDLGPQPGWYAIDVNFLHGAPMPTADGKGGWRTFPKDGYNLTYFLHFEPVGMAGYSIYIYHITPDEANRVRRELGLPELPGSQRPSAEADDRRAASSLFPRFLPMLLDLPDKLMPS